MGELRVISYRLLREKPLLFLLVIFLAANLLMVLHTGIVTNLEASKYIRQGTILYETGTLGSAKYLVYLPVILLVYVCRLTGLPVDFIVLLQVFLSAVSLFFFYKLVNSISGKWVALVSSSLLASFLPLQQWNVYLYSDSLFISLSVIFSYILFTQMNKGRKGLLIILFSLILLAFTRPHALLFIPPVIIFLVFRKKDPYSAPFGAATPVLLLLFLYFLANLVFTGGEDMDVMRPFLEEHIICFVPTRENNYHLNVSHTGNPLADLLYYLFHNPLHFLKLTGLKLLSFFNQTRVYYSPIHNAYLLVVLIPVYLLSVIGLPALWKQAFDFRYYLFALLILFPFGATFQCDDWHSRFTMPLMPYLFWIAGTGLYKLYNCWIKRTAAS